MTKRKRIFPRETRRAFTLLEILLVLGLMAILLAGLSSMIQLFSRHYSANERRVSRAQLARSISQMLSDDLGAAVQDPIQDTPNDPTRQYVRHFGLRGDARSLQIDVVQPNSFASTADAEENRRVMSGGDKTLYSRQVPELKTIFYEFVPINALREGASSNVAASSASVASTGADETLGGSLTSASGSLDVGGDQVLFWDGFRPLVQKYGLSRRELDYETPDEDEEDASTSPSSVADAPFDPNESTLSGSLTSPPSSANSTLAYSELEAATENAAEAILEPPMTAVQIAMDADDGTTWAPEVLDCRFSYYDGTTWFDSWDSLEKNGLPTAIKVELKLAPLDDVDLYRNSPLMTSLPLVPDLETIAKAKTPTLSAENENDLSRLSGSLTATAGESNAESVDVFNSYRTPDSYTAAFRGVALTKPASAPFDRTQTSELATTEDDEEADENSASPTALLGGALDAPDASSGLAGGADLTNSADGEDEYLARAEELEDAGATYNSAGVCVDFANDGSYATLEGIAAEIGASEPDVFEFIAYLPTTPFSRAKTIHRREPTVVRSGAVTTRRGAETANSRRAAGQNPYATGRARAPRERTVATREARERAPRERTATSRNPAERAIPRERAGAEREAASRAIEERTTRDRNVNERTARTRQTRERFGADWLAGVSSPSNEAPQSSARAPAAPRESEPSPSAPTPELGAGGGLGGGIGGGLGGTTLPSLNPFAIVDQQTGDVPFADASSPFASADAALDITTPGLIASPTGASTTETPNPTTPAPSTGQTQRQTWIRGKK